MKILSHILMAFLLPASLIAGIDEWVSVVKVTDNFKSTSYQVMSNEEYTKLTKSIWHRNRLLNQAIRLAREEWIKGDDTKDKVYPVNITCKAEVERLKTFPDAEKAKAYAALIEEEESKKQEARRPKSYIEQRIEALQKEIVDLLKIKRRSERQNIAIRDKKKEIAVLQEELAKRRAKEAELRSIESQAQGVIKQHLDALVAEFEQPNYDTPKAF